MNSSSIKLFNCPQKIKIITLVVMFFASIFLQAAQAQMVCPDVSVNSSDLNGQAYNLMNSGNATCNANVAIPSNGIRAFTTGRDCKGGTANGIPINGSGRFTFVAEDGGEVVPNRLTCDNCPLRNNRELLIASGTMANVTARFVLSGGAEPVIYRAQISRTALDVNGDSTCSITNASITGGAFGGDAIQPTVTIGALNLQTNDDYTAIITLSENSTKPNNLGIVYKPKLNKFNRI